MSGDARHPLDKNTRWLSDFETVADIQAWLAHHGVYIPRQEWDKLMQARQYRIEHSERYEHTVNYKLSIVGRIRKGVKIERKVYKRENE